MTEATLAAGNGTGVMQETVLPSGIRVLTESLPGFRSVSVGVWVRQGAAHEPLTATGASHLLEHMVFKGTERRGPKEIALALERVGGTLDAFTSREHTSYQARVLGEHLPDALDVLSDLVLNPVLRAEDLELEREVVLEEISTVEDTPDDQVYELHGEALWGTHPYGQSILGTRESVTDMPVEMLRDLHRERYRKGEMVVAGAGHLDHQSFVASVAKLFDGADRSANPRVAAPELEHAGATVNIPRESAQTHIVFGARTPGRGDRLRYPLVLLASAFGGGMSSRLFQRVREELALAYSVYSFQSFYSQAGVSGVYVGTRPGWEDRAVEAIREEFTKLSQEGLPEDELRMVKDQVKGQVMLSLESGSSRLYRLAGFAIYDLPYLTLDDLLAHIEGITRDDVMEAASRFFDPDRQVVLRLGPVRGS